MLLVLIDILILSYFNIPTFLIIFNFRKNNFFNIFLPSLFLSLIIYNNLIFLIITTVIYFINKYFFTKLNALFLNIINLLMMLLFISLFSSLNNAVLIIIINTLIYYIHHIFFEKNILFTGMIKYGKLRRYNK